MKCKDCEASHHRQTDREQTNSRQLTDGVQSIGLHAPTHTRVSTSTTSISLPPPRWHRRAAASPTCPQSTAEPSQSLHNNSRLSNISNRRDRSQTLEVKKTSRACVRREEPAAGSGFRSHRLYCPDKCRTRHARRHGGCITPSRGGE